MEARKFGLKTEAFVVKLYWMGEWHFQAGLNPFVSNCPPISLTFQANDFIDNYRISSNAKYLRLAHFHSICASVQNANCYRITTNGDIISKSGFHKRIHDDSVKSNTDITLHL